MKISDAMLPSNDTRQRKMADVERRLREVAASVAETVSPVVVQAATAQSTANTGVTNAATAQSAAVTAAAAASVADGKAVTAQNSAVVATTDAAAAQSAAVAAQGTANAAVLNAAAADAKAVSANSAAGTAQAAASNAISAASTADAKAVTAQGQANTATTNAASASTAASAAQLSANAATTSAATAQTQADTAVTNAATAQTKANLADTNAATAAGIANAKAVVLYQTAAPTAAYQNALTLWIDTTSNLNTPKKWVSGSTWAAVTDKVATDAASAAASAGSAASTAQGQANTATTNAATAQTAANTAQGQANTATTNAANAQTQANTATTNAATAQSAANTADGKAVTAQTAANTAQTAANNAATAAAAADGKAVTAQSTANGKNKIIFSTSAASGTAYVEGDTWFKTTAALITGQWAFTAGAWAARTIDSLLIANLDAGKITAGIIAAARIDATTLQGKTLQTAASGARVVIDATGLKGYDAASTVKTSVGTDGILTATDAVISGTIRTGTTGKRIIIDGPNNLITLASPNGVQASIEAIDSTVGGTADVRVMTPKARFVVGDTGGVSGFGYVNVTDTASNAELAVTGRMYVKPTWAGTRIDLSARQRTNLTYSTWFKSLTSWPVRAGSLGGFGFLAGSIGVTANGLNTTANGGILLFTIGNDTVTDTDGGSMRPLVQCTFVAQVEGRLCRIQVETNGDVILVPFSAWSLTLAGTKIDLDGLRWPIYAA
ncbi:hypothetical protein E3T26_14480 [Cryobacterium sp. TMT1-21]|uniref:hypothetical protein n=1 Tax=Cryobacterium sp. TMT1-21 TaxID=1259234 RepID=UPI00106DB540|nr:hypothetical protein [Cryobacterium sp. TMT1-21]TFD09831.1 hypothetical protein E3T26_14480 [Cryobacterium sp. TMT1-21]